MIKSESMLTIFTIPKPFVGHIDVIQRNAIKSWILLRPECEIILIGDEIGIKETANEYGIRHIPKVERNEFGTPLLNSAFNLVRKVASKPYIVYINTDIILMSDFTSAIQKINLSKFLISGRRWDVDIKEKVNFSVNWEGELREIVRNNGKLHGSSGIDYFLFPKSMYQEIPPFAVGRVGWDNWMIYHAIKLGIPVIDITPVFKAIHQNHDYSHLERGQKQRDSGEEAKLNIRYAGGWKNLYSMRDATHRLTTEGIRKQKNFYNYCHRIFNKMGLHWMYKIYVTIRRMMKMKVKR